MRFVFVDRVLDLEPGRAIETIKSVSASEDVFADHFPGFPILPGALVVEAFAQGARLLIAESHGFMRGGRLVRLTRAAFRRFVRPGDQLRVRCERRGEGWTVVAGGTGGGGRGGRAARGVGGGRRPRDRPRNLAPVRRGRRPRLRELLPEPGDRREDGAGGRGPGRARARSAGPPQGARRGAEAPRRGRAGGGPAARPRAEPAAG